jgi:arylformamidase
MRCILAFLLSASTAYTAGPRIHRDLAYAEQKNERQTLDLYAPAVGKGHPVVFWIHGGGWQDRHAGEVAGVRGPGLRLRLGGTG